MVQNLIQSLPSCAINDVVSQWKLYQHNHIVSMKNDWADSIEECGDFYRTPGILLFLRHVLTIYIMGCLAFEV